MKKIIAAIALLFFNIIAYSQASVYFPNLTRLKIDSSYFSIYFNYDKNTVRLINTSCFDLPKTDFLNCTNIGLPPIIKVASFKNEKLKDTLFISYSPGPSVDPSFSVWTRSGKNIFTSFALEFYINQSGIIYISGHINNMFDKRQKFQIVGDTVIEVRQPYYYVGIKGQLLKSITLYKEMTGNEVVAQLPKDYEIEILLSDNSSNDGEAENKYLVKTSFGLVGWLRLDDTNEPVILGLNYAGD